MPLKILLVDDHKILRDGLRSLIERHKDLEIVGEADSGLDAVRLTQRLMPDLVLMDITMPDLNGIDAARQIISRHSSVKIIALSMHTDRRMVNEMLRAGAAGYLLKETAFDELIQAIRSVMRGGLYLSPSIAQLVVEEMKKTPSKAKSTVFTVLTDREREVLQLMAEGQSTKEIASKLSVSDKTIETHRRQIMDKLKLYNVAELTKYAIREGLTTL